MSYGSGASAFKLAYEISPISLVGGIAGGVPGGIMSIFSLLQTTGLTSGSDVTLDDSFANFYPIAGSSLIENQYGTYPYANLAVAANARISQPIIVSLSMRIPVRDAGGYANKTFIMTALQNTLDQHCQLGGYFHVATPTFFYANVLLNRLHDTSTGESNQAQVQYQWDFYKPLITQQDAATVQNAMMSLLSSGGATDGSLSGVTPTIGNPGTTATPAVSPGATGNPGAGIGGYVGSDTTSGGSLA